MAALFGVLACGCTVSEGDFSAFGPSFTRVGSVTDLVRPEPAVGEPRVVRGAGTAWRDQEALWAQGYVPIGYARFKGSSEPKRLTVGMAKAVGAEVVVVSARFASSHLVSGLESGPVQENGGGVLHADGTIEGPRTSEEVQDHAYQYVVADYDQTAVFFARGARRSSGLLVATRSAGRAGQSSGLAVKSVRQGSPAFMAAIAPGDVLLKIDDLEVHDAKSFARAVRAGYGHAAVYHLVRGRASMSVTIAMNPDGSWIQ